MCRMTVLQNLVLTTIVSFFTSCEKDFDINLKPNKPLLIVEGYINNELPSYNYVILGRSQDYFNTDFENIAVTGAKVSVTEGRLLPNNTYEWNAASKKELTEARIPLLDYALVPGLYFDPALITDPADALMGRPGYHYLLEIEADGKKYSATTAMLPPVRVDSLTIGNYYNDDLDDGSIVLKGRITVHYKDPDTIGNTQLYYWQAQSEGPHFGWGGMGAGRYSPGTDDLVNGQYIRLTHGGGFVMGDSVIYHMASVERKVYNFWDSFNKARANGGPFSTPATISSTISGEDVLGCFSGFSLSSKAVRIK
ncbi:DUF4249 domain-containing protein [Pseudobacter ginsenosidimutans]|uniref:Uncharacterized protein DUF4249 n=1 Tax=Pseudobacter ginsenosidimutans TaxID=661488 RepID=A0A4Q7MYD9_9BACT|nr:DUF4249 domain-containing protein [Pseudobacter ginsenosidimutans]QEC42878.1 DUF4249 domain-containing protein [Pseudobacter ginsenosidimutans]RZS74230.1 uncharacterized protein DUF4249 [Pseudobacter ginsenosidimutans]